jgi:aspartyl aminopeptidase
MRTLVVDTRTKFHVIHNNNKRNNNKRIYSNLQQKVTGTMNDFVAMETETVESIQTTTGGCTEAALVFGANSEQGRAVVEGLVNSGLYGPSICLYS